MLTNEEDKAWAKFIERWDYIQAQEIGFSQRNEVRYRKTFKQHYVNLLGKQALNKREYYQAELLKRKTFTAKRRNLAELFTSLELVFVRDGRELELLNDLVPNCNPQLAEALEYWTKDRMEQVIALQLLGGNDLQDFEHVFILLALELPTEDTLALLGTPNLFLYRMLELKHKADHEEVYGD